MKRWIAALLTGLLVATTAAAESDSRARHVFIISIDQGGPAALERADMPVLDRLVAEGAHTWEAFTIVPSLTLPSHTSMLTGVGIQKHQIDWNDLVPEKGLVKVPTIFALARAQGLSTAMIVGKVKFRTLVLPRSVDRFVLPEKPDGATIAREFSTMLEGGFRPNLCFLHFADPDGQGHAHGVMSPEKMKALAETDAALGEIVAAIKKAGILASSVLIITADHGGHDRPATENEARAREGLPYQPGTHGSSSPDDVTIPWVAWGYGVRPGFTITAPVVQYDTAATALWLLGVPRPEGFWGRPVTSAFAP